MEKILWAAMMSAMEITQQEMKILWVMWLYWSIVLEEVPIISRFLHEIM